VKPVALITYSSKPRGGVVHTLAVADALHRQGFPVHVFALGNHERGFFRPVAAPHSVLPAPEWRPTLTERVFASIDALECGLSQRAGDFDILHTQDCMSARAAARVRDAGARTHVVRTVHHVDEFTTRALVDCQRAAILEPDTVLVVSQQWRGILRDDYGVAAHVVHNGVDPARFRPISAARRTRVRAQIGAGSRFVFLSVGGIEPRKGSVYLFEAMARLRAELPQPPMLVIVGGESFQDYAAYRRDALASLRPLGLRDGRDVVVLGTVTDAELLDWYGAADALAFPSIKEGWGLAVLEALAVGLPVLASDLPVFREYLRDGDSALLPVAGDSVSLANAMCRMVTDAGLRARLQRGGARVVPSFTWDASARRHREIYAMIRAHAGPQRVP
jgi:glycosyltransferase-like protein